MPMKNGKYICLINLVVMAIVLGLVVQSEFTQNDPSAYLFQLSDVPHYVTTDGFVSPVEVSAGENVNAKSAGLPSSDGHTFMRPGRLPYIEFTITAMFDYTKQYDALKTAPDVIPAILIPGLGDSFEIYINGNRIASEWHMDGENITVHKWVRNHAYLINPDFFKRGENILVYRIFGDPTTIDTGLTVSDKYLIDDYNILNPTKYESAVFAGIYIAIALIFFVFSFLYRHKKQNLWFALSALFMALYTFVRLNAFQAVLADYEWAFRCEIISLSSFSYFATVLIYSCGKEKFNAVMKVLTFLYILCMAAAFLPGHQFLLELMDTYLIIISLFMIYTFVFSLCVPIVSGMKAERQNRGLALPYLFRALSSTLRGNMLLSALIPIVFSLIDGLDYIANSYQSVFLSQFGLLFFAANMALALAYEITEMHNTIVLYSQELKERKSELLEKTEAAKQATEEKTQFIASISREIKVPVNEIIGTASLALLKGGMSEDIHRTLSKINSAGRALLRSIGGEQTDEQSLKRYHDFASHHTLQETVHNTQRGGMHHFFVINPKSFVTKTDLKSFLLSVEKCFSVGHRAEYKVFISRYPRDASSTVYRYISNVSEDTTVRVYAVGGDGIAFDCLNGMVKFKNAELATVPYGNSNDICRSFGEENMHKFRDIKLMSKATSQLVDVIQCGALYALSSCSIGIEAYATQRFINLVERVNTGSMRRFVALIYNLGAVASLLDRSSEAKNYAVTIDGEDFSGDYILINCGNMAHNGGSNTPNPLAKPNDGELDVITYKQHSILRSLLIMPDYTKGKFAKHPDYFRHKRFKELQCESEHQFAVILDGETFYTNSINLKVIPSAVKIVSPNGINFADYSHLVKG